MKRIVILTIVLGLVPVWGALAEETTGGAKQLAQTVLDKAGISRGVCCVIGAETADLPVALAETTAFLVHVLDSREAVVAGMRQAAEKKNLDIKRLLVEQGSTNPLPYTDNVVDLLVAIDLPKDLSPAETLRVLRPRGKAVVIGTGADAASNVKKWLGTVGGTSPKVAQEQSYAWAIFEKPLPAGTDNWTHWEHGPDNNPVSTDAVIKAPYMTQWLADPYYIAMPAITTAAGGRTFTAMGHIAHHEREEPWLNTILARNGYNGIELWRRRLPDGYLVHRSAFIATDDVFYMIDPDGSGCLLLDPETGEQRGRIAIPEARGDWKWIALEGQTLFALVGDKKDPPETTVVRSKYPAWSWGELSEGYYAQPQVPWGFGNTIVAYDVGRKAAAWAHREESPVDSRGMAIGEGKVFFYEPEARLGCLDIKTGKVVWTNEDPEIRKLIEEPGHGLSSTPGFRTQCLCVYTPKGLFYQGQTQQNVVAVSKDDGHVLWHRPKTTSNPNVVFADEHVLVGIGPDGNTLELDPATGATIRDLGFKKRSCARLTATPDSYFCRGDPEGVTRYDRRSQTILFNGSVRPACNDGVIGANGLLYIGPWLCDCNLTLMGTVALASAQEIIPVPANQRLEAGRTPVASADPAAVTDKDWSAYRGNSRHTASAPVALSPPLQPVWTWKPKRSYTPTAPTTAGGSIFVAGDDGVVRALDAETGVERWTYATAGPIIQPPTIWEGRAYVGSGDGYVYALNAAGGQLEWRFLAAPIPRRTMIYGALCSTWPVNTGVLIEDGVAYCAAGIIDFDGTYLYALDARTGALKWVNATSGSLDSKLRKGISAQGNLTVMDHALWMAGGNVLSPAKYALNTGDYLGPQVADGSPRANRGEEIGVFGDSYLLYGGRVRYSALENVVSSGTFALGSGPESGTAEDKKTLPPLTVAASRVPPAWDDRLLVISPGREGAPQAFDCDEVIKRLKTSSAKKSMPAPKWDAPKLRTSQVVALALAKDAVVAACSTPRDRMLAPRWRLSFLNRDDGAVLSDYDLPSAARSDGLALDRDGRVIVALANGGLCCYGGRAVFQSFLVGLASKAESKEQRHKAIGQIHEVLNAVHDADGRAYLIGSIEKLGEDVFRAAKEAGAITQWRLLGPVPWDDDKNPLDKKLVGEPKVKVDRPRRVEGQELVWQPYVTVDANGMVDLAGIYGALEGKAVYAYAEFDLPEAADVLLKAGSNDGFKCWFNGKEVGRFDGGRRYVADQDSLKASAKKGKNVVLMKITQQGGGWAFGVRVTDPAAKAIPLSR